MDELIKLTEGSEDELVNELLDNESPFFFLSSNYDDHGMETNHFPSIDPRLVSTLCSGPTIKDVESSLSDMNYGSHSFQREDRSSEACRISGLGGIRKGWYDGKKKYSLRIKNHGNAITDDGYKWRKYGRKSIKNSPNPRSYYRCGKPSCNAKKRVEQSMEDPDTLIVTYEGLHVHLDFPISFQTTNKRQRPISEAQKKAHTEGPEFVGPGTIIDPVEEELMGRQGLLEDIVPFVIRNPLISKSNAATSSSSSSPASSNSLSRSINYSLFGLT